MVSAHKHLHELLQTTERSAKPVTAVYARGAGGAGRSYEARLSGGEKTRYVSIAGVTRLANLESTESRAEIHA